MSELGVALLAFACIATAGLLALRHVPVAKGAGDESKETVRFVQGIVASMSALLLSLLLAASAAHYRAQGEQLRHLASELLAMDRMLAEIGPAGAPAREALRSSLHHALGTVWAPDRPLTAPPPDTRLFDELVRIVPSNARETYMLGRALDQSVALGRLRASLITAADETALQAPLLLVLVSWFVLLFVAMGHFASPNRVSVLATLLGAAVVSSALFLVLELDQPFGGLITISDKPLRMALGVIGGG
jgi:hypothetical protein